jgi:hypothetical protein
VVKKPGWKFRNKENPARRNTRQGFVIASRAHRLRPDNRSGYWSIDHLNDATRGSTSTVWPFTTV